MLLKALQEGGFAITLPPNAGGEKRQTFRVSQINNSVFIPDDLARQGKEIIDRLIADGMASLELDTDRVGPRAIRVAGAELGFSTTPNALFLDGEPIQAVVAAYKVTGTTMAALNEGTAFEVTDGEVFMIQDHSAATYAVFFVQN